MIAVDLSKQQALDPDPKAIQQINFTRNLHSWNLSVLCVFMCVCVCVCVCVCMHACMHACVYDIKSGYEQKISYVSHVS